MARPGGNPDLKGVKGRSGRYSVADEALKNRVKHKAWKMKEDKMNDNEAIQIVTKDMTLKTEHSGVIGFKQIIGTKVIKDNGNNNIGVQNEDR